MISTLRAAALLIVFAPAGMPGQVSARARTIDSLVRAYARETGIPGLSYAVIRNGITEAEGAVGFADVEQQVRATIHTKYRTASIGKTMTAAAALRLWQDRRLDLDAPIQTYCPSFPRKPWPITIRHLLSHTSGIRHYSGPNAQAEQFNTRQYATVAEALEIFAQDSLLFQPGTRGSYSSYGYNLAGCGLEGAARMSFAALMDSLVFRPAGMRETLIDDNRAIIPNRAAGYAMVNERLVNGLRDNMSNRLPAGGYLTTARDLARFGMNLLNGRLIADSAFRLMVTPPFDVARAADAPPMGLGIAVDASPNDLVVFHGGSTPMASGVFLMRVRGGDKVVVAILTNLELAPDRVDIAARISDLLTSRPKRTR